MGLLSLRHPSPCASSARVARSPAERWATNAVSTGWRKVIDVTTERGYVYALIDCSNGEPIYVGLTLNPLGRMRQHMSTNKGLRAIIESGGNVVMFLMFTGCLSLCSQMERYCIEMFIDCGITLSNGTMGGEIPICGYIPWWWSGMYSSAETRTGFRDGVLQVGTRTPTARRKGMR